MLTWFCREKKNMLNKTVCRSFSGRIMATDEYRQVLLDFCSFWVYHSNCKWQLRSTGQVWTFWSAISLNTPAILKYIAEWTKWSLGQRLVSWMSQSVFETEWTLLSCKYFSCFRKRIWIWSRRDHEAFPSFPTPRYNVRKMKWNSS